MARRTTNDPKPDPTSSSDVPLPALAQSALSEQEYKRFCEHAVELMCVVDFHGRFVWTNASFLDVLGYPRSQVIGHHFTSFIHEDDVEESRTFFEKAVAQRMRVTHFRNRYRCIDGSYRTLDWTGEVPPHGDRVYASARDVTERISASKRREELLRSLYEDTPVMMYSVDAAGRIELVSERWLEKMGYTRNEVVGRYAVEFMNEDSRRHALEELHPSGAIAGQSHNIPYQFVSKRGDVLDILYSSVAECDEHGAVVRSRAVLIDLTERNRALAELQRERSLVQALLESLPEPTAIADDTQVIRFANLAMREFYSGEVSDLIGTSSDVLDRKGGTHESQAVHGTDGAVTAYLARPPRPKL